MTYKTVNTLKEADNKATAIRKYDPNQALRLSGIKALNETQLEAFEEWWDSFIDMWLRDASKDDVLFWGMKETVVRDNVKKQGLERDESTDRFKPLV